MELLIAPSSGRFNETVELLKDYISVMGLSPRQFAALLGAGYSLGQADHCDGLFCRRNSFSKSPPQPSRLLSNVFFTDLLNHQWHKVNTPTRKMLKVGRVLIRRWFIIMSSLSHGRL